MKNYVTALAVYYNKLIVGRRLLIPGDVSNYTIASWDGSSWDSLGSGINGSVLALVVYGNKLIAGGQFTTAGGVSANYIASWNGSSWDSLGSGMNDEVTALTVYNKKLIAGGGFTGAGHVHAEYIIYWNGLSWSPLGSGIGGWYYYPPVCALAAYDSNLIVGGYFTTAGGRVSAYIAQWTKRWDPSGPRGDANGDGVIDISDVVYLINYLFINGPAPVPLEAGDANCNGMVDVRDVVYLLNYLFVRGAPAPGC
jgi:hypothetical protein